ncbi:MAG: ferrous iron transport protein A [Candidatus Cloacimonadota bacterium]|nr:MAG: ferrous iron transport protein A [Candidatus Cloacimonadota bacterium]
MRNKPLNKGHQHNDNQHHHGQKTIHDLRNGESSEIKDILGGRQFINKAESLGIRKGVKITKVSSQMMHGPVTIKVGQTQIALGHRMANKIIVK